MGRDLLQQVINRSPISTHLWVHIHRVIITRTLRSTIRRYLPAKMSFGAISASLAVGDTSHVGTITPTSGGITCLLNVAAIKKYVCSCLVLGKYRILCGLKWTSSVLSNKRCQCVLQPKCHECLSCPYFSTIYRVSQEECARLRESVSYAKVYRYNLKHLCPNLNGYGDNGQWSLKRWQLLHTYWLPNTY